MNFNTKLTKNEKIMMALLIAIVVGMIISLNYKSESSVQTDKDNNVENIALPNFKIEDEYRDDTVVRILDSVVSENQLKAISAKLIDSLYKDSYINGIGFNISFISKGAKWEHSVNGKLINIENNPTPFYGVSYCLSCDSKSFGNDIDAVGHVIEKVNNYETMVDAGLKNDYYPDIVVEK